MKKQLFATLCAASMLMLAACGSKTSVIPDNATIQSNLQNNKYTVSTNSQDIDGTALTAISGSESLTVLRFNSAADCDRYFSEKIEGTNTAGNSYKFSNDAEFGNIIISGTKEALKAAGITIVKAKD